MAYSEGNVNGLWRLKPTGKDHCAIGVEMPAAEPIETDEVGSSIYGAMGEIERPKMTEVGDSTDGIPRS